MKISDIRARVSRIYRQNASVVGHVDRLTDGFLHGWALSPKTPQAPVLVQCRLGDKILEPILAIGERIDVAAVHPGASMCGFSIDVRPLLASLTPDDDRASMIDVFAGYENFRKIGSWRLNWWLVDLSVHDELDPAKIKAVREICLQILARSDMEFSERERELPYLSLLRSVGVRRRDKLGSRIEPIVAPTSVPETRLLSKGKRLFLSNYVDQQRYRFNVNRAFRLDLSDKQYDAYLHWYLSTYGAIRAWRRAPLSRHEIDYLNSDSSFAGPTRAMLFFLPPSMSQGSRDIDIIRTELSYWWTVHEAPARFVEDCLIPDWCFNFLGRIRKEFGGVSFKLNYFMERYFSEHPELHFLDMSITADRLLFYVYFLIKAAERPDLLRLLPRKDLGRLLGLKDNRKGDSAGFVANMEKIFGALGIGEASLSPAFLSEMVSVRLFDIETLSFATMSKEGHRVLSAGLPLPPATEKVDVQIIGPFQKASGLGQAARLSAAMIERAGFNVGMCNLGLDNPAPEGYSSMVAVSSLKNAPINIVHLNGESVQLAFSYMPNVFEKSYNIGYFYWELDTPAACHHLSIELLDEIWVSSEYCREIYASVTSKPVINVGMCAENLLGGNIDEARRFVRRELGFKRGEFIFLAAFDSFSFVQRKNPLGVIRAFRAAFPDDPNMRLVIKTHNRTAVQDPKQLEIWFAVDDEIEKDDRIVLLDETLTYADLRKLKSGVDCYVSLHRSEGWGFGMIEAMASGVPVVATAYSGNMDFCREDTCWLVDYELTVLYPDDYIFVAPGQKWAEPKLESAVTQMRSVAYGHEERTRRAKYAADFIRANFSEESISRRYKARLQQLVSDMTREQPEGTGPRSRRNPEPVSPSGLEIAVEGREVDVPS